MMFSSRGRFRAPSSCRSTSRLRAADLERVQHRLRSWRHDSRTRRDRAASARSSCGSLYRPDANRHRPARAVQRALEEDRRESGRPVDEMCAFRLTRFDAGNEHLRAAVDRCELNPALPHPVVSETADSVCVIFAQLVTNRLVERDENFSHIAFLRPGWCNRSAALPSQQNVDRSPVIRPGRIAARGRCFRR